MENEGQGSGIDISSRVDPTSVMPPFDQGKPVSSLSIEEAAKEFDEMTLDKDGKYARWPRSVFSERRAGLFKKGKAPQIEEQQTKQKEANETWLEEENQKIEEREDRERSRKAQEINIKFFGSEKEVDRMIEGAVETVRQLNEENRDFLNTETPNGQFCYGDLPSIISLLSGISGEPDLIQAVNSIGLEKLIRLADKSGVFRRRR